MEPKGEWIHIGDICGCYCAKNVNKKESGKSSLGEFVIFLLFNELMKFFR